MSNETFSKKQREELLKTLKARFEKNMNRHRNLDWTEVLARLEANPEKLRSLHEMERTGGEPDVVSHDKKTGEYIFYDCSTESPTGRRNLCYDREALEARKKTNQPTMRSMSHRPWELNCSQKKNIANCRSSAPSIRKHRVG
jgi:hypothetical protein